MSESGQKVNWVSVINFLQKEHTKVSTQEQEWNFQRQSLIDKINRLQAELDSSKIMIVDLLNRIKLLEIALLQQKSKRKNNNHSKMEEESESHKQVVSMIAKYKLEEKVRNEGHQSFLKKVLADIGINSKEVMFREKKDIFDANQLQNKVKSLDLKQSHHFTAHLDSVQGLFKSEKSDALVSISEDCLVKFWSVKSFMSQNEQVEPVKTYRQHTGPLFSITGANSPFNPEQSIFFTGGSEGLIKYWKHNNVNYEESGKALGYISNNMKQKGKANNSDESGVIWSLSLLQNKLLSSSSDGYIRLFEIGEDLENEEEFFSKAYREKEFKATCVTWMNKESFINGCSNATRGQLWDIEGRVRQIFTYDVEKGKQANNFQINQIKYCETLKYLSFACEDGILRLFSPNHQKIVRKIPLSSPLNCLEYLNDWNLICGGSDGTLSIWDLRTYQKVKEIERTHSRKYDESLTCMAVIDKSIVSGGADGLIKIYK